MRLCVDACVLICVSFALCLCPYLCACLSFLSLHVFVSIGHLAVHIHVPWHWRSTHGIHRGHVFIHVLFYGVGDQPLAFIIVGKEEKSGKVADCCVGQFQFCTAAAPSPRPVRGALCGLAPPLAQFAPPWAFAEAPQLRDVCTALFDGAEAGSYPFKWLRTSAPGNGTGFQ